MNMNVPYGSYDPSYNSWISFKKSKFLCKEWQTFSKYKKWFDKEMERYNYEFVYFDKHSHQLTNYERSPETCFINERKYIMVCKSKKWVFKHSQVNKWFYSFRFMQKQFISNQFDTKQQATEALKIKRTGLMLKLAKTDVHPMFKEGLIIHAENMKSTPLIFRA